MRNSIFLVVACLAVLLAFLLTRGPSSDEALESRNASDRIPAPAPAAPGGVVPEAIVPDRQVVPDAPSEGEPPVATASCVVQGRLIDDLGAPIADAAARLYAYKVWAAGEDVDRLEGEYDYRGWELHSDEAGRFRFDVPVPTNDICVLEVRPDVYHDLYKTYFGGDRESNRPPLTAGTFDLGDIRLATTGAISGTVVDEAGVPLRGVKMGVGSTPSTTYGRDARTDENGAYVIEHLVPGEYGVKAALDAYLSEFEIPFDVTSRRTTSGVNFTLRDAPTLRGHVVATDGTPIAGARLWGWPKSSGSGAGADSAEDGSFTVHLPQDEPYSLGAERDGYVSHEDPRTYYEQGRDDVLITLEPSIETRFVVVARSDGTPIEEFGLRVIEGAGELSTHRPSGWIIDAPRVRSHPGGEVTLSARPGLDRFELVAPGFRPIEGEIEHESPESNRQVIRMASGLSLAGRVTLRGEPVSGASVVLERGRLYAPTSRLNSGAPTETVRFRVAREGTWKQTTGDDGRFSFAGLAGGEHRLDVVDGSGNALRVYPLDVAKDGAHDLGDLDLLPGATITGTVLAPTNCSAAGLRVDLGGRGASATTDADGRFRFDGLVAGEHALNVHSVPGRLASGDALWVEVEAEGERDVVLDVRARGMCQVSLQVDAGERPLAGAGITLVPLHGQGSGMRLGSLDEDGRVTGSVRAAGEARIGLRAPGGLEVRVAEPILTLTPGGQIDTTIRLNVGSVRIELSEDVVLPQRGYVLVRTRAGTQHAADHRVSVRDGRLDSGFGIEVDAGERAATLPWVLIGSFAVDVEVTTQEGEEFRPGLFIESSSEVTYRASRSIEVREGEETRVRF